MKNRLIPIVLIYSCIALKSEAQSFNFKQGSFTSDAYLVELPYENVNDKIIIKVEVKGKQRRFLLDTGAPLAISQQLFEELKPAVLTKQTIRDINQKKDSLLFIQMDSLKIGDVYATGIPAIVLKSNLILECLKLDGFLGSNVLQNSVIQFDTQNQKIRIANDTSNLNLKGIEAENLTLDSQGSPFLKFKIGKKISEYAMFDSGSDVFYSMAHGKVQKMKRAKDFEVIHTATGSNQVGLYGVAGNEETYLLRIPFAQLNGVRVHSIISETSTNSYSRLGSSILKYGLLTIDYKMKTFYFKPYAENTTYQSDEFQINPTFSGNKFLIGKIWEKELEKIVNLGDEIIAIDDINLSNISVCDMLTGILRQENTQRKLDVKRKDGSTVSVTISKIKY